MTSPAKPAKPAKAAPAKHASGPRNMDKTHTFHGRTFIPCEDRLPRFRWKELTYPPTEEALRFRTLALAKGWANAMAAAEAAKYAKELQAREGQTLVEVFTREQLKGGGR